MIEVAIQSVSAVFDWKEFVKNSSNTQNKKSATKGNNAKKITTKQTDEKQTIEKQTVAKQTAAKQTAAKQTVAKPTASKSVPDMNAMAKSQSPVTKPVVKNSEDKPRKDVKPQIGGLAYTGKVPSDKKASVEVPKQEVPKQENLKQEVKKSQGEGNTDKQHEEHNSTLGRNKGMSQVTFKPNIKVKEDEEDDEILKALDKFFDDDKKDN
jgi:hypothetical protein